MFFKILQYSRENNFIKKKLQHYEHCEITKNTFSYRAPPLAASELFAKIVDD